MRECYPGRATKSPIEGYGVCLICYTPCILSPKASAKGISALARGGPSSETPTHGPNILSPPRSQCTPPPSAAAVPTWPLGSSLGPLLGRPSGLALAWLSRLPPPRAWRWHPLGAPSLALSLGRGHGLAAGAALSPACCCTAGAACTSGPYLAHFLRALPRAPRCTPSSPMATRLGRRRRGARVAAAAARLLPVGCLRSPALLPLSHLLALRARPVAPSFAPLSLHPTLLAKGGTPWPAAPRCSACRCCWCVRRAPGRCRTRPLRARPASLAPLPRAPHTARPPR